MKNLGTLGRRSAFMVAGISALLLAAVVPAHSQFGFDTAALLAGLKTINSTLKSALGGPLSAISKTQQKMADFEQQTVYPQKAIQDARQLANTNLQQQQQQTNILAMPRSSATLASTRPFEQTLMSGDPNGVASVNQQYASVYGSLPSDPRLPPSAVALIDINDAHAKAALKKAIQLDALAAREMEVSRQILQQLRTASPGTAPMLSAQASAWVLQAQAYTQSGMAELLRLRSVSVSSTGTLTKVSANDAVTTNRAMEIFFRGPGR